MSSKKKLVKFQQLMTKAYKQKNSDRDRQRKASVKAA